VATPEEIFGDHAYFSSYSSSWIEHARRYVEAMIARFGLGAGHQVVEGASNDGYLLRHFVERGVPVLGIEHEHSAERGTHIHPPRRASPPMLVESWKVGTELPQAPERPGEGSADAFPPRRHTPRVFGHHGFRPRLAGLSPPQS
jgi:hypothetical protein